MTLIDKTEALAAVQKIHDEALETGNDSRGVAADDFIAAINALSARGVGVPADVKYYAIDVSEAYDTMMEVQRNPAGAWQVIQALAGHIAAITTTDAAQAREAAAEAMAALSWAKANLQALSCRAGNEGAEFPIVDRALASLRLALIKEPSE